MFTIEKNRRFNKILNVSKPFWVLLLKKYSDLKMIRRKIFGIRFFLLEDLQKITFPGLVILLAKFWKTVASLVIWGARVSERTLLSFIRLNGGTFSSKISWISSSRNKRSKSGAIKASFRDKNPSKTDKTYINV